MAMILVLMVVGYLLWSINTISNINKTVGRLETELQELHQRIDGAAQQRT